MVARHFLFENEDSRRKWYRHEEIIKRKADRKIDSQKDRQTDKQTTRPTHTYIHTVIFLTSTELRRELWTLSRT